MAKGITLWREREYLNNKHLTVSVDGQTVLLTKREHQVFQCLCLNQGNEVDHKTIHNFMNTTSFPLMDASIDEDSYFRLISVMITKLQKKINASGTTDYIRRYYDLPEVRYGISPDCEISWLTIGEDQQEMATGIEISFESDYKNKTIFQIYVAGLPVLLTRMEHQVLQCLCLNLTDKINYNIVVEYVNNSADPWCLSYDDEEMNEHVSGLVWQLQKKINVGGRLHYLWFNFPHDEKEKKILFDYHIASDCKVKWLENDG